MNNTQNATATINDIIAKVRSMNDKLDAKINQSKHAKMTKDLRHIMRGNQPQPSTSKVDIIDALSDIQKAYTKIGRNIPNFTDSMNLIGKPYSS
jgi:polyhydroxyalkanoate synthesis regulator phasin